VAPRTGRPLASVPGAPPGVAVPPHLAALVDRVLGYGLDVLASRNGQVPDIPELDGLRARLRELAMSARGRAVVTMGASGHGWLTASEAAHVMGLTDRQARRLARGGQIISRKRGRDWEIDPDAARGYRTRRAA
jgi:hypothetical protein